VASERHQTADMGTAASGAHQPLRCKAVGLVTNGIQLSISVIELRKSESVLMRHHLDALSCVYGEVFLKVSCQSGAGGSFL
jgi:hypothetical protein